MEQTSIAPNLGRDGGLAGGPEGFAPGPWRAAYNAGVDNYMVLDANRDRVGQAMERSHADLMAAALDLLDVAEAVVTACENTMLPSHVETHLLNGARAAIAKARKTNNPPDRSAGCGPGEG